MKASEYWRLTIIDTGGTMYDVYGEYEAMKESFDAVNFVLTRCDDSLNGKDTAVLVQGFSDTADRAPVSLCFRYPDIRGARLMRMV